MKKTASSILIVGLFIMGLATMLHAADEFHLSYEQKVLSFDNQSASGVLLVHLVNNSGVAVRDVVARIPGPNLVTYDQRTIFVGDLDAGQPKEAIDEWRVPIQLTTVELPEGPVTWRVEYTNLIGDRVSVDVVGEQIQ